MVRYQWSISLFLLVSAKPCYYYGYGRAGTDLVTYANLASPEACQVFITII